MLLAAVASAEEIDGEVNVSLLADPYQKVQPGFGGSYRPEFLQFGRFSLGAGFSISISDRFLYDDNGPLLMPDSVAQNNKKWYYERDYFIEFVDFDFYAEGRWQFLGDDSKSSTKGWLSLNLGAIVNSATQFINLTNFLDSSNAVNNYHYIIDYRQTEFSLKAQYRTDLYLSPGLLLGLGNFYFGYRHWFFFDSFDIADGEPARMLGTVRLGYRFIW